MKRHIVCYGDSNTHGYCADVHDSADGGNRFGENERWTRLLERLLGEEYLVLEEGLGGRTTVFEDPLHEGMSALSVVYPILMSHEPIDLLVIMLGTNDTKERFSANPSCIGAGLERLIIKAKTVPAWKNGVPNILIIAPPHIHKEFYDPNMGEGCAEKSAALAPIYETVCKRQGCAFLDAEGVAEFNNVDHMHLTRRGHAALAARLADIIPTLL